MRPLRGWSGREHGNKGNGEQHETKAVCGGGGGGGVSPDTHAEIKQPRETAGGARVCGILYGWIRDRHKIYVQVVYIYMRREAASGCGEK